MSDRQFSLDRGIKTCRRDSRRGLNNKGEGYDESRWAEVLFFGKKVSGSIGQRVVDVYALWLTPVLIRGPILISCPLSSLWLDSVPTSPILMLLFPVLGLLVIMLPNISCFFCIFLNSSSVFMFPGRYYLNYIIYHLMSSNLGIFLLCKRSQSSLKSFSV